MKEASHIVARAATSTTSSKSRGEEGGLARILAGRRASFGVPMDSNGSVRERRTFHERIVRIDSLKYLAVTFRMSNVEMSSGSFVV